MNARLNPEYLKDPGFRRFYIGLWIVIALVVGGFLSQLIPTGVLEDCTVESVESSGPSALIESSCGTLVSYRVLPGNLRTGGTYDFQMRGFIVRHADSWTESGG